MTEQDFLELIAIDENTNRLKHRENSQLEFKANFNKADFALYAKTLAAFSNNQGGIIVFGVKDKP
ncbi:ATP-binding protein, partial [Campylobacter coli]|nr:ATP-binding protein [Campylobacter coli]EAH5864624.1 ATP-binding protein [Campylobacter coli]EAL8448369.1 ATP-binding protein [Campylobacter coli]EAW7551308.1 ATP-binding protein [Campylobacter coli]EIZ1078000.1 ATP-binding protein [Campylobacter coli]